MTGKIDLKKEMKDLYRASAKTVAVVGVPTLSYLMVDGEGDPNTSPSYAEAVEALFPVAYAVKFMVKKGPQALDYGVMPLEGLWWADDPADFTARRKDNWRWTMMIMAPDVLTQAMFAEAVAKAGAKLGNRPDTLRLERYAEGRSLQVLHVGSYDDEGPILAQLHDVEMPARGVTFNGHHHEIYLGDARRTAPDKLRTILRQPVRPA